MPKRGVLSAMAQEFNKSLGAFTPNLLSLKTSPQPPRKRSYQFVVLSCVLRNWYGVTEFIRARSKEEL
jgi:hypothetical protein